MIAVATETTTRFTVDPAAAEREIFEFSRLLFPEFDAETVKALIAELTEREALLLDGEPTDAITTWIVTEPEDDSADLLIACWTPARSACVVIGRLWSLVDRAELRSRYESAAEQRSVVIAEAVLDLVNASPAWR